MRFDDPALGIDWHLPPGVEAKLSDKDRALPTLADFRAKYGEVI